MGETDGPPARDHIPVPLLLQMHLQEDDTDWFNLRYSPSNLKTTHFPLGPTLHTDYVLNKQNGDGHILMHFHHRLQTVCFESLKKGPVRDATNHANFLPKLLSFGE